MNVSLIIPLNENNYIIKNLLNCILELSIHPSEIIIIDSSINKKDISKDYYEKFKVKNIQLFHKHCSQAYPGKARNIGIEMANYEIVSFLDVNTIPKKDWLENGLKNIQLNYDCIFGSTLFLADNFSSKLIRDSLYGSKAHETLPGSIMKKSVIKNVGLFVENVRAGEDSEWINRAKLLSIKCIKSNTTNLEYLGLLKVNFINILKKWYRNYSSGSLMPQLYFQKIISWMFFIPFLIFLGLSWNNLVPVWRMDSPYYIHHVTKIILILIPLTYLIFRGIIRPINNGLSIFNLLPLRFILIASTTLCFDLIKFFAFIKSLKKSKNDN